jgi:hypothetical protein
MKRFALPFLIAAFALMPGSARADISNMDVGGDLFLLFYYGENTDDFNDSLGEEVDFLRSEAHVWFKADLEDNVMVRISVEADRAMESFSAVDGFDRAQSDLDVFLEEGFVKIANVYDSSLSFMAGRMFMNFGDNPHADNFNKWWGGSFWFGDGNPGSPQDLAQLGTWEIDPFDAVVLEWDLDTAVIDAFYAQAVDDPGLTDMDLGSWGINASYTGIEGHQLDGYFIFTDGDWSEAPAFIAPRGEIDHFLVGARLAGDLMTDTLSYKLEGAYNFGDIDDGGVPPLVVPTLATRSGDFDGFGVEAGLNWHPENEYNPDIGFIYTFLQGDGNNLGALDEDFDGILLPYEGKTYGEIANSFVFSNAHVFHLTAGADLNEQWSLSSDWYYLLLDEDVGNSATQLSLLPRPAWNVVRPEEDDELGWEWDLQLNYTFSEAVGAFAGGGVFWPGDAVEEMNGGDDDEAYFFRTGMKVTF